MENKKKLGLLSIAYQSALEYDYCPEPSEASKIKENFYFAENYTLEDIEFSLEEYEGYKAYEIAGILCHTIDSLFSIKNDN